jgi:hypothetical protein
VSLAVDREDLFRAELARHAWGERDKLVLESGDTYREGEPVRVRVRRRDHRYAVDDDGGAARLAGASPGWLAEAERVVDDFALNVNRRGIVFVPAVEGGMDLAWLAGRVAECSLALYGALLDLDG